MYSNASLRQTSISQSFLIQTESPTARTFSSHFGRVIPEFGLNFTSVAVLADTSLKSPRKICILIIKECIYRKKVSQKKIGKKTEL